MKYTSYSVQLPEKFVISYCLSLNVLKNSPRPEHYVGVLKLRRIKEGMEKSVLFIRILYPRIVERIQ
jgi:hypothetical protein